jgi:hypothetical protein
MTLTIVLLMAEKEHPVKQKNVRVELMTQKNVVFM